MPREKIWKNEVKKIPVRPLALVTGASSGIGYELAKEFARNGFDLVLAAEDDGLENSAYEVSQLGTYVEAVQVDLATPQGVETLYERVRDCGRPLAAAAINAGVGVGGSFVSETTLHSELKMIQLNVTSTVHLAKLVTRDMVAARAGRVLFTSSMAARMPSPYLAIYAATKAFVQSFAEAIREELRESGVTVTALMPGATDTNFFRRAGMLNTAAGKDPHKDSPARVAKEGFAALMAGKDHVVTGAILNKVQAAASKVLSDPQKAKMTKKQFEKTNSQSQ